MCVRIDEARRDILSGHIQRHRRAIVRLFCVPHKHDPIIHNRDVSNTRVAKCAVINGAVQKQDVRFLHRHFDRTGTAGQQDRRECIFNPQ